ncbi:MAG: putative rep protein [Cressdnaviricota sp.]|nr:MAG: putative rep protein [Cressdnaviricota sp.]
MSEDSGLVTSWPVAKDGESAMTSSAVRWCGTLNIPNVHLESVARHDWCDLSRWDSVLAALDKDKKVVIYLVAGKEFAPSTGQPHYQFYMHLSVKKRGSQIRKAIVNAFGVGYSPFLAVCKGTPLQNYTYCRKGGDFYELGDWNAVPK